MLASGEEDGGHTLGNILFATCITVVCVCVE